MALLQAFANLALDNYADFLYIYDIRYYAELQQWYKGLSRVLGVETFWRFDKESYALYIDDIPSNASKASVLYLAVHVISNGQLTTLEKGDEITFKKLVLAKCKQIEGVIRGKYSTIPAPGGQITLNADYLLNSGKEEDEKIIESLVDSCPPGARKSTRLHSSHRT